MSDDTVFKGLLGTDGKPLAGPEHGEVAPSPPHAPMLPEGFSVADLAGPLEVSVSDADVVDNFLFLCRRIFVGPPAPSRDAIDRVREACASLLAAGTLAGFLVENDPRVQKMGARAAAEDKFEVKMMTVKDTLDRAVAQSKS